MFVIYIQWNFSRTKQILPTQKLLSSIYILKFLAMMFIPESTTNAMTSDFLPSISPGWVVMFLDSHRMLFTFLSWLDLLEVVRAFWFSILKIFKLLPNYWHRVTDITRFEKHLESSSVHTLSFYPNLVKYGFENIFLKESLVKSSMVI